MVFLKFVLIQVYLGFFPLIPVSYTLFVYAIISTIGPLIQVVAIKDTK